MIRSFASFVVVGSLVACSSGADRAGVLTEPAPDSGEAAGGQAAGAGGAGAPGGTTATGGASGAPDAPDGGPAGAGGVASSGGQPGAGGFIVPGGTGGCWHVDDPRVNVPASVGTWCEACETDEDCAGYDRPHVCIQPGVQLGLGAHRVCRPTCDEWSDCQPFDCVAATGPVCLTGACPTDVPSFLIGGGQFVCNGLEGRVCNWPEGSGVGSCSIVGMTR